MKPIIYFFLLCFAACTAALTFPGCSLLSKIPKAVEIKPEFTALKANEDVNAVKASVQGDIAAFKGDVARNLQRLADVQAEAIIGITNTVKKMSAGRDMVTNNDTEIYRIQAEVQKHDADLWKAICAAILGVLMAVLRMMFKFFQKYLYYKEQAVLRINTDEELKKVKDARPYIRRKNK